MKPPRLTLLRSTSIGLLFLAITSTSATAATVATGSLTAYERERAACLSGQSNQDRATCLREAGAARAEAGRRGPTNPADEATLQANRIKRCAPLPEADRRDCESRMAGAGTTSGSAAEGGIYRELVTREPAAPAIPAK